MNTYTTKDETLVTLQDKIESWSIERGINTSDPVKQALKIFEEGGELASAIVKSNEELEKDSIGDLFVTLVVYCQQRGIDFQECIEQAYDEIKDRKGKMVNGVFVKEEDIL